MKILLVFGTRPEAIKMAPLVHELRRTKGIDSFVCVTGQHREMLDSVLEFFDIKPDFDLNIMKRGQDLFDVTSDVILNMRSVLTHIRPDILLVHGDTSSAMAAALSGFYLNVKIGHVEAGLRTYNLSSPFPEELNRQFISKVANLHFTPTEICKNNLLNEDISPDNIFVTGNTVIDALHFTLNKVKSDPVLNDSTLKKIGNVLRFQWESERFVLVTGHRRENFGDGFENICKAISRLALTYNDVHFVYPVHLNPNVREPVYRYLDGVSNIHLIEPLDYVPFVCLMDHSFLILTDSGGIQEEAPSLGKPVLVMRKVTERPEGVASGVVKLVGTDTEEITRNVGFLIDDVSVYEAMSIAQSPYGDGTASKKIAATLSNYWESLK